MKNFAIVVPIYQTPGILHLFLESLAETLVCPCQIILINDGSGAQISSMLSQFNSRISKRADVAMIEHRQSQGCAASINDALKLIKKPCDYVVFLDSDLILQSNWQNYLIEDFLNEKVGIVGGVLLYPQTGGNQCCGITYQNMTGRHLMLNAALSSVQKMGIFEIQATVFAFCAIRYSAVQAVGYLDDRFFNGYEDWDYQFRVREKGYIAITDPRILHYHWEKSNGVHRDFNRKSNLGRFWSKHGDAVKDDLCIFVRKGIENDLAFRDNRYQLLDLCESKSTAESLKDFLISFDMVDEYQSLSALCGNQQAIWLPEILHSQAFRKSGPYLFLCDHFVRLLGNQYWWTLRQRFCEEDKIVDTYGNVIPFKRLQDIFWPGTKIR